MHLANESERRSGKIRRLLFFDNAECIVVAGVLDRKGLWRYLLPSLLYPDKRFKLCCLGFLDVWDISTNTFITSLVVDSPIIELAWLRYGMSIGIVVLCVDGTQRVYRCNPPQIVAESMEKTEIHQKIDSHKGSLSCLSSIVASSSGFDVIVRDALIPKKGRKSLHFAYLCRS
jgi:hypothetical protein